MTTLITKEEACQLLNISTRTLQNWRDIEKLKQGVHYLRFSQRKISYCKEALLKLGFSSYQKIPTENNKDLKSKKSVSSKSGEQKRKSPLNRR